MELETGGHAMRPRSAAERAFYYLAAAMMILIAALMAYAVAMRYVFRAPPFWSEEVLRVLFLWMVFLSLGLAIRFGLNIRVTFFVDLMSADVRRRVEIAMHLIVIAMVAVLFWYSIPIIQLVARGKMMATGWNNAVAKLPLPVGCLIVMWHQGALLLRAWRGERA